MELATVQRLVLETRKQLDFRKNYDKEIFTTVSRIQSDISQAEYVASVSHEDLENKLDTIESLRTKVLHLEDEVVEERTRAKIFNRLPVETCNQASNAIIVSFISIYL